MRVLGVATLFLALAGTTRAQGRTLTTTKQPLEFSDVIRPASTMDATLRVPVQEKAGRYPLGGFAFFGRDSIILVFVDSNYTGASRLAGTWMFGPAVTPVEADGCPPEKVIGRQIARVLFRALGRPGALKTVIVAVHGTRGLDRWSVSKMYFYPEQLTGKWAGDPIQ